MIKAIIGAIALTASFSATAHVIDFNDTALASDGAIAGCSQNYSYKYCGSSPVTYDGLVFSSGYSYFIGPNYNSSDASNVAYDGDDFLLVRSGVQVSQSGGGSFTLNQLDITNWYDTDNTTGYYDPQKTWRITGDLLSGGSIFQDLTLDDISNSADQDGNDFQNFALSGFADITSFSISALDSTDYPFMTLDNIEINAVAVPEPGTLAIFGLGLAGLAFSRSKK